MLGKRHFISIFVLVTVSSSLTASISSQLSDELKPPPLREHSLAPILGYEPTYGFVAGGAYFYHSGAFSAGTDASWNFGKVILTHATLSLRPFSDWEFSLKTAIMKGYKPYYGEGGETLTTDFRRLWGTTSQTRLQMAYKYTSKISAGFFMDGRTRTEEPPEGTSPPVLFPNEMSGAIGVFHKVDTRNNEMSPKDGFVLETSAWYAPRLFSNRREIGDFAQAEGEFIAFKEMMNGFIPDVIGALRLMGGLSLGTPSFPYEFELGGAGKLSGYLADRFRGQKYYLEQTEIRFPILRPVSGAVFVAFGDVTESSFTNPKMSYGAGLRIGLPPDWINMIRIDFGVGHDQSGIFADFGQTF